MRIYEELFIVRPDATEEEVDPLIEQLKNVITHCGGTIDKTEKWGVRTTRLPCAEVQRRAIHLAPVQCQGGHSEGD